MIYRKAGAYLGANISDHIIHPLLGAKQMDSGRNNSIPRCFCQGFMETNVFPHAHMTLFNRSFLLSDDGLQFLDGSTRRVQCRQTSALHFDNSSDGQFINDVFSRTAIKCLEQLVRALPALLFLCRLSQYTQPRGCDNSTFHSTFPPQVHSLHVAKFSPNGRGTDIVTVLTQQIVKAP